MSDLSRAVSILRAGGLVAFPTETVYGLGADASNGKAVARLFWVKGRPPTNPVIVHVSGEDAARRYAAQWPPAARKLAARFWPGPLTLVVPRGGRIVPEVSAGLDTVGLRCPDHPLALELLRSFDGAIAAPSANRSTRISPTTAQHVRDELGDAVDAVLDGGPCRVGIESTVLDVLSSPPCILRPGGVSREQIQSLIGPVAVVPGRIAPDEPATSPGQHALHYAPMTPTYRFSADQWRLVAVAAQSLGGPTAIVHLALPPSPCTQGEGRGEGSSASRSPPSPSPDHPLPPNMLLRPMPPEPEEYARQLYVALRDLDHRRLAAIFIQMPPDEPRWLAVRDRLMRASRAIDDLP